jgi:SpoVK/Ycf46/Vps4 family AAA+-type ATPase
MYVDISETKSKWFSESEKLTKAIFTRYRKYVGENTKAPILLFNEADGVFSKRRQLDDTKSGPGQTENAIQNIILQEMENLKGILICTTNLTKNFDKAFERRFLYKIEFEKPSINVRQQIWRNMIPDLGDKEAIELSACFDLSGGQIENIARKRAVDIILKGKSPTLDVMKEMCRDEIIDKGNTKCIGFGT